MAGQSGLVWLTPVEDITDNLDRWYETFRRRLSVSLVGAGRVLVTLAKTRHPWRNRTGMLEASITSELKESSGGYELEISENTYYAIFVETRWGGRWGVLPDVVDSAGEPIMSAIKSALGG